MEGDHGTDDGRARLVDVLDRILDKGIVIAFQIDISVAGLRVIGLDGRTIVASVETHLRMVEPGGSDGLSSEAVIRAADQFLRDLPGDAPRIS